MPLFRAATAIETQYNPDAEIVLGVGDARQRLADHFSGTLRRRPLGRPVHQPTGTEKVSQIPEEWRETAQNRLLENKGDYE